MHMSIFKDKTLMITGGTGSFGNAVLKRFLSTDIREIRIFSRDEKKQEDEETHWQRLADVYRNTCVVLCKMGIRRAAVVV